MITQQILDNQFNQSIRSKWPWDITTASGQLIDAYAASVATAFYNALSSLVFAAGTVSGGTAPPGGPVLGAVLSYTPGSLSGSLNLEPVFVPPVFKIEVDDHVLVGSYTPWLRKFTETLSQSLSKSWQQYTSLWSAPSIPCVGGGSAAWVSATPPLPGPWAAGTITTPFILDAPATGQSTYQWDMFASEFKSAGAAAQVTLPHPGGAVTTSLFATPQGFDLGGAVASGIADIIKQTLSTVTVYDPTGLGGSGTALPGGVITPGVLVGAALNLNA